MRYHLLAIFLFPLLLHAGEGNFRTYSIEEGLPAASVYDLLTDDLGRLWIATEEGGVACFDGYDFHIYNLTNGLSSNLIRGLFLDASNNLWLATDGGGVNLINRGKTENQIETFTELDGLSYDRTRCITQDETGRIWVGTFGGGISIIDRTNDSIIHLTFFEGLPHSNVRTIKFSAGKIWAGTDNGLAIIDPNSLEINTIAFPGGSPILCMTEDRNQMFVGMETGIYTIDKSNINAGAQAHTLNSRLNGERIRALALAPDGGLWVGTRSGLYSWSNQILKHFTSENGLANDRIRDLEFDSTGNLWIGTYFGGISRYKGDAIVTYKEPDGLPNKVITSVLQLTNNEYLVSTVSGTAVLRSGVASQPSNLGALRNLAITSMKLRRRELIIGTAEDGFFQGQLGNLKNYRLSEGLSSNQISCLTYGEEEDVWIGTEQQGVNLFRNGEFIHLTRRNGLPSNVINDVAVASGIAYIATDKGLVSIPDLEEDAVPIWGTDPSTPVIALESKNGVLYFLSSKGELGKVEEGEVSILYKHSSGLRTKMTAFSCLIVDSYEQFWLGTNSSIFRITIDKDGTAVKVFDKSDGYHGQVVNLNAGIKDAEGRFWFGTINGMVMINPNKRISNHIAPKIFFSDVLMNYDEEEMMSRGMGDYLGVQIGTRKLGYDDNTLTFHFTGINLSNPENVVYQWKLEGADANWSPATRTREITYSNLKPGNYTFKVRAANEDGIWSETEASFEFSIAKPFYQTWIFRILMGLIVLLTGFLIYKWRVRNLNVKKMMLEEEVEKRTRELKNSLDKLHQAQEQLVAQKKLASLGELTAGIAHEIKNPLNFVNNFSELNFELVGELQEELNSLKDKIPTDVHEELNYMLEDIRENSGKINEHGKRADSIVRNMLDHSRAKSGEKKVIDINRLLSEQIDLAFHGTKAKIQGLKVRIEKELAEGLPELNLVPSDVGRVFINILNNGFYAINEKNKREIEGYDPVMKVSTEMNGEFVYVRIRDNGPGIPDSVLDQIFNPFFTTKPTGSGNTGLGLSLSHDIIVKQHHGKLEVDTRDGEFTEFKIALPITAVNEN